MSLSATIKALQQENEHLEVGAELNLDDPRADLIDHLVSTLGRTPLTNETDIEGIINKINLFKKSFTGKRQEGIIPHKSTSIVSSRLRTLKQYQDSLNKEINDWDELLQQRKNKYNFSRLEKQMVSKGEKKITNSHRAQLPRLEEAWLRDLSDGTAEMSRLKKQEVMMKLCKESLCERMARKRKSLDDKNVELEQIAKRISETACQRLGDIDLNISNVAYSSSLNIEEPNKCKSTSEFAKDVQAWVQEMQSI